MNLNPLIYLKRIHNPDSSHITSESVDLKNLDSTDYGCEICLLVLLLSYPSSSPTLKIIKDKQY